MLILLGKIFYIQSLEIQYQICIELSKVSPQILDILTSLQRQLVRNFADRTLCVDIVKNE